MKLHTLLRFRLDFSSANFFALNYLSIAILTLVPVSLPTRSMAQQTSSLWGVQGELWSPQSRLSDFSFAGYHMGNDPIPNVPVVTNVKDFGAKGDGVANDSQAFINAIAATNNGALFIPGGRYKIAEVLNIRRGGTVLRGAGRDKTTLYFPKSLTEMLGHCGHDYCYSWTGGVIDIFASEIGIEDLTIEFPNVEYAGHHDELGYNAIELNYSVTNSWVRNVTIHRADNGILFLGGTNNNTVTGVTFTGRGGHHGFRMTDSHANLVVNFRFDVEFIHDITTQYGASGNVFANGSGININFDHHSCCGSFAIEASHHNLFSDIDLGRGSRPYESSGAGGGPNGGPGDIYWNIQDSSGSAALGDCPWPQCTVVGATHSEFSGGLWMEGINPANLFPKNIYEAQVGRRLGGAPPPPPPPPPLPPPPPPPPASPPASSAPPPASNSVNLVVTGNPVTGPYAVEARTNAPGDISVHFYVNGNLFRVESSRPYSLFGDNGTPYLGTLGTGTHVVEAKVYGQTATPLLAPVKASKQTATSVLASAKASAQTATALAQAQIAIVEGAPLPPPPVAPGVGNGSPLPSPPVTPGVGKSLINSATVIRHSRNFASNHPAEHLWDGCLDGTPECTAGADNIASFWIEFDLGKIHDVNLARLFGDTDGNWWSTSWTLEYKQNPGDPWSTAFKNANAFQNGWSTQQLSVATRYVRVEVFGNQSFGATQAREMELYGTPR